MPKSKLVKTSLDQEIIELVKKTNHKTLGIWAADCVERVLPYFEEKYPEEKRPRKAIEALRTWVQTGVFKMADVRKIALASHAAAREVEADNVARSVARATGQALATAHVPTHSIAATTYAVTAIRDITNNEIAVNKERQWQYQHLTKLRNTNARIIHGIH